MQYLDSLWEQLCRLRDSRWTERPYAPAAALTGSASGGHGALLANWKPHAAFEHQLADAQTHNLPALPLPAHTPDAVYPPPRVVFRLFDAPGSLLLVRVYAPSHEHVDITQATSLRECNDCS